MDEKTESVLSCLEKTSKEFWNVSRQTANFLNILIKVSNRKNALEIGTSNGYSGIWLAKALKETGGHLTTLEFWEKRISVARKNFEECGVLDIITTKLGSACDILEQTHDEYDFVFMDANKSGYLKIFREIDKLLLPGGIILANDIISHAESVKPFVDEITKRTDYEVQILDLPDGVLFARKKIA